MAKNSLEMGNPYPENFHLKKLCLDSEAKMLIEELRLVAIRADAGEVKGQYSGKS